MAPAAGNQDRGVHVIRDVTPEEFALARQSGLASVAKALTSDSPANTKIRGASLATCIPIHGQIAAKATNLLY